MLKVRSDFINDVTPFLDLKVNGSKMKYSEPNLWVSVYYKHIPSFGKGDYYNVEVIFIERRLKIALWFDKKDGVLTFFENLFDKHATFDKIKGYREGTIAPVRIALELAKRNFNLNNK